MLVLSDELQTVKEVMSCTNNNNGMSFWMICDYILVVKLNNKSIDQERDSVSVNTTNIL